MRILFILCGFFIAPSFFCLSMQKDLYNTIQNYNSTMADFYQLLLEQKKQSALNAISLSIEVVTMYHKILPKTISLPPTAENEKIFNLVEKSLDTLANFLNTAHSLGSIVSLNPINYSLHNNEIRSFYAVSAAIDFLHIPLLVACKRHATICNNPLDLSSMPCLDNNEKINALSKCNKRITKCFEHLGTLNTKNDPECKIGSYLTTEWVKLSKILGILTVPNCYE